MKPSVSGGIPESAPERSTTRSQWSQVPRTAPKRGGAPAVENRMSFMPRPSPNGRRANVSRPRPPCSHHTSCRWRLPAFARGLHPLDVLGPAEDVIRIAVRETLVRDSHALEVRVEHHREPRLHLPARRERALGGIPLGTVRRGAGVERERAFLDDAFAGAIEGVAEEHQFVRIDVEVRVRSRDLARMPSRHDGDKRAEGETAVWNVAGLERLMHRWGRVDLAGDAVVALHVEDERVQGAFPSDEIERVVAQGDAGDLPTSVLHIDREFSAGILERRQVWGLDLRFDDRRHQGGLALFVQVVRRERDRVDRLDQEEPRLRREFRHHVELSLLRRFHLFRRIEAHMELAGPRPAESVRPVDLLPREHVRNRVELRVRGRRHGSFPHDHRHRRPLASAEITAPRLKPAGPHARRRDCAYRMPPPARRTSRWYGRNSTRTDVFVRRVRFSTVASPRPRIAARRFVIRRRSPCWISSYAFGSANVTGGMPEFTRLSMWIRANAFARTR